MESWLGMKIFVGGISSGATEETLRDHFRKYGEVVDSVIVKDRNTGNTKGFGFVLFSDAASAENALQDRHVILGRTVDVKKALPRGDQHQPDITKRIKDDSNNVENNNNNSYSSDQYRTKKIFVGGLPSDLTEDEFKAYFEKFGRIRDVVVMYDNVTHRPRGFGFITFDSENALDSVMQNAFHELNGKRVEVKPAVPKDRNFGNHGNRTGRMAGVRGGYMYSNNYNNNTYFSYGPRYGIFPGYMPPGSFASGTNGGLGVYPTPITGGLGSIGSYHAGFRPGSYPVIAHHATGYGSAFVNGLTGSANPWNGVVSARSPGPYWSPVYPFANGRSPNYAKGNKFASAVFFNSQGIPLKSNEKRNYNGRSKKATGGNLVTETKAERMEESSSSAGTINQNGGSDTQDRPYPDLVG